MVIALDDSDRLTGVTVARCPEGIARTQSNASLLGIDTGRTGGRARIPKPCGREENRPSSAATRRESNHGDRFIIEMLTLVRRVAARIRKKLPPHMELDDLVAAGHLGLLDALRRFDIKRDVKFATYARHRIRGAILDGLRSLDTASRDLRKKNRKAEKVYRQLEMELGRPPSDAELAAGLGVSLEAWYRAVPELQTAGMDWLRPPGSVGMKQQWPAHADSLAADNDGHQFDSCFRREQREILDRALARIPERERQIVRLYYQQELTMKEIGKRLRIDESRVSQLHSAALARLRLRVRDILSRPQPLAPQYAR
ncbi:MAG: FliA/WhiG family RNA polymerase sigma factor [Acidobacteriia bacterium]|nr:FliA/WhiG family RNA polymerase sigma factor [Terriglobia bacterium]